MQYLRDLIVFIQFLNGLFVPSKTHRCVGNMGGGGESAYMGQASLNLLFKKSLFSGSKAVFLGKNESSPLACALPNQFLCIT